VGWIECKSVWVLRAGFAEVFEGREAFECLESSGEVVGPEDVCQMRFELFTGVVEEALDGCVFDGSVHARDLSTEPNTLQG